MLHPQSRALLDLLIERGVPPIESLPHLEARRTYRDRKAVLQPAPQDVAQTQDLVAFGPLGAIPMRLYRPTGPVGGPALVYFHGGGWVIGDLETHDTLCRELANAAGMVVVAVDYRLAPEHRFPAAYDDAFAATRWVHAHAADLGVDPSRIAVGGDSAGGNLAAAVCLAAREGGPPIAFQLLIYPATDMRRGHASHVANGEGYLLTAKTIGWFHDHYIDDPRHDTDWRASPLLHVDHRHLPPALVITAGYDPLRDEGLDYARVLTAAGNHATSVCFDRQIHGFITMGKVLDEADSAIALCAAVLARRLHRRTPGSPPGEAALHPITKAASR